MKSPRRENRVSASGRRKIERLATQRIKRDAERTPFEQWFRAFVPTLKGARG